MSEINFILRIHLDYIHENSASEIKDYVLGTPAKKGAGFYPGALKSIKRSLSGSQTCAVEGAYAPRTPRQERGGVLEFILLCKPQRAC